ncbi:MAG: glutamate synthase [Nitrososphaerota archaeon]
MLRKRGAPPISPRIAFTAIECVRYRGSRFGAGFGLVNLQTGVRRMKAFAVSEQAERELRRELSMRLGELEPLGCEVAGDGLTPGSYVYALRQDPGDEAVRRAVQEVNRKFFRPSIRAHVYAWGRHVDVFKGVGYPADVYQLYDLERRLRGADLWVSHTRQPTNSPGRLPIWSHPFSSGEWVAVHNGDVSSFGANMSFLESVGFLNFVGTDSEVIAFLLDHLTSVERLPLEEACRILVNPFEDYVQDGRSQGRSVVFRGARLDGPFTVVAGYSDGKDVYMAVLADRFKFRPVVVGEDENYVYAASEEVQIRAVSPDARVWTLEPGSFMLASSSRGVIIAGRKRLDLFVRPQLSIPRPEPVGHVIDASELGYQQINRLLRELSQRGVSDVSLLNVRGQRYIGVGVEGHIRVRIYGTPGNCLANLNDSIDFEVFGSVQDDVGDVMHGGSVVVHGDARDVLGQALQGGEILVKGNAGNRCGIQMREYEGRRPYLVVGGRVDDYLGEYMAGGVIVVLGLGYEGSDVPVVGRFAGTGMVGGRIYVRGTVPRSHIGYLPPRRDVLQYLRGLWLDGELDGRAFESLAACEHLDPETLSRHLPPDLLRRVMKLFEHKYFRRLLVEERHLNEAEVHELGPVLRAFGEKFSLEREVKGLLDEKFTVIHPSTAQAPKPVVSEEG